MSDGMTNIKASEVLKELKHYTEDLPHYSPDEVAETLEMGTKELEQTELNSSYNLVKSELELQPRNCKTCIHSEEQDGSNCYECIKGMGDNFEAQQTGMRDATEEERKSVKDYIKSISKPTGFNFYKAQPCEDAVSRADVKESMQKYGFHAPDMTVTEFVEDCLPPVIPQYTDEEIDKAQAVEQAYVDKMVELTVEEVKRLSADCISKYIKQKIDYLEDLASIETNEGRWREEEKYLYAISVLEEVVEYMNTSGGGEE